MFRTLYQLFGHPDHVKLIDEKLLELIDENPDFVYSLVCNFGCCYHEGPTGNEHNSTGCIFGQAFQRLGISVEYLKDNASGSIKTLYMNFSSGSIHNIPRYWPIMQRLQDSGSSWKDLKQDLIGG